MLREPFKIDKSRINTDERCRGGSTHSSVEVAVMVMERRS